MKKNNFVPISIEVVEDEELSVFDKGFYATLCCFANEHGIVSFIMSEVMREWHPGINPEMIEVALFRLQERCYIEKIWQVVEEGADEINVFYIADLYTEYTKNNTENI